MYASQYKNFCAKKEVSFRKTSLQSVHRRSSTRVDSYFKRIATFYLNVVILVHGCFGRMMESPRIIMHTFI